MHCGEIPSKFSEKQHKTLRKSLHTVVAVAHVMRAHSVRGGTQEREQDREEAKGREIGKALSGGTDRRHAAEQPRTPKT